MAAFAVLVAGLLIAIPKDVRRARARRHGQRLKGPELVAGRGFNRRTRADGVGFLQVPGLAGRLTGRQPMVRLPQTIESSHLLIMGDSGLASRRSFASSSVSSRTAAIPPSCTTQRSNTHRSSTHRNAVT